MALSHSVVVFHSPISKHRWDSSTSLLPGIEKKGMDVDISFMLKNLNLKSELITKFDRLRIKINLYRRNKIYIKSEKAYAFDYQNKVKSILYELNMKKYSTSFFVVFFRFYDRIERILLWFFNHRRI